MPISNTGSSGFNAVVTGPHLSGTFGEELATNASFVPTSNQEVVLKLSGASANVLALRNTDATGYSALTARDYLGNERFAIGYGNPSEGQGIFASKSYIQTWKGDGVPPNFVLTADGDYGNTGSGYRPYQRLSVDWNPSFQRAQFNVWHHIPWGTTQRVAFQVEVDGNVQNLCKVVQSASDCAVQLWKDATPTKAVSYGLCVPGNAPGDDLVFATYTGSAWVERLRVLNGGGVSISNLPTSDPGIADRLWNSAGTVKISAG
jgi:hypothetical protein